VLANVFTASTPFFKVPKWGPTTSLSTPAVVSDFSALRAFGLAVKLAETAGTLHTARRAGRGSGLSQSLSLGDLIRCAARFGRPNRFPQSHADLRGQNPR
jgi:hypothetical protein